MDYNLDLSKLVPAENIAGDDAEDTKLLVQMYKDSLKYVNKFSWSPPVDKVYFGFGIGGIIAVFLYHFKKPINRNEKWLWVAEGDIPSAYFAVDRARNPKEALEAYCELMEEWADAVIEGNSMTDVFPVEAKPSKENAALLLKRIKFIRNKIISTL